MIRSATTEVLVEELIEIMLHQGTPYFLLASNIKENNYEEIRFSKEDGRIIVDMFARDLDYHDVLLHFRYTYSASGTLLRREQVLEDSIVTLWDRESELKRLVNAIKNGGIDHVTQLAGNAVPYDQEKLSRILAQAIAV